MMRECAALRDDARNMVRECAAPRDNAHDRNDRAAAARDDTYIAMREGNFLLADSERWSRDDGAKWCGSRRRVIAYR